MSFTRLRPPAALLVVGLLGLGGAARADDPPARGADAGQETPSEPEAPPPKAPDLVAPTPALAKLLAPTEGEAEPARELKRVFLATLHYLFSRDLERLLPYFHPAHRMHVGQGEFEAAPPEALREVLGRHFRAGAGRPKIALAEVLVPGSLRVLSRARAAEPEAEGRDADPNEPIDPARVARWMEPGDWLVLARLDHEDLPAAVFYVLRRDGERFKVVLAE